MHNNMQQGVQMDTTHNIITMLGVVGQQCCIYCTGLKKRVHRPQDCLGHQHGRHFIVLGHQYGGSDIM